MSIAIHARTLYSINKLKCKDAGCRYSISIAVITPIHCCCWCWYS